MSNNVVTVGLSGRFKMVDKSFYSEDKFNEKFGKGRYDIENDIEIFKEKIGIKNLDTDKELQSLIDIYVSFNHKASLWYKLKHDEKVEKIERYQVGRLIVLLTLPIAVYFITKNLGDNSISSNIAVIISGLIAAYRASSQWLEAKITSSSFINTATCLKMNIYEFQNEWNKDWSNDNISTLKSALKSGIKSAKEIIDQQRKIYFERTLPKPIEPVKEITTSIGDIKLLTGKIK